MASFKEIHPEDIGNAFDMIGKRWMLVSAKHGDNFNMMTASWGGMGVMWGKNIAVTVVRPSRYTYGFIENSQMFTLSFLPDGYRDALSLCGTKSGRDIDKVKATGLTPVHDGAAVYFDEADIVLVCKKIYTQQITPECFTYPEMARACYPDGQEHTAFIGEIVKTLKHD